MSHQPPEGTSADKQQIDTVFCLAYSPTADRVVGGTTEGTLWIWDAPSGDHSMGPLSGNEELGIITHVSFVTDDLILSASDSIMHQWDAHSGEFNPDQFKGHEDPVIIAACLPDRRTIASLGKEGVVLLWDRHTLEIVHDFLVGLDSAVVAAFSLDGTKLVAIQRGRCCIWDVERGEMITEFIETPMAAMQLCVAFVSDSTHVIIGYGDGYLRRWDIESWEMVGVPFGGHDQPIVFIVCSPDGKLIATSAFDAKTHLWDGETHEVLTQMDGSGTLVFSPDSRYSARSTVNRQLIIDEIIMLLKDDALDRFLDIPIAHISKSGPSQDPPDRTWFHHLGTAELDVPFPQFVATSGSPGRPVDDKGHVSRGTSGSWLARLRQKMPRYALHDSGEHQTSNARNSGRGRPVWIAPARDKDPVGIASQSKRQGRKNLEQQRDGHAGGETRELEQIALDPTQTRSSSSSTSESEGEQKDRTSEHGVGCCWPRFK